MGKTAQQNKKKRKPRTHPLILEKGRVLVEAGMSLNRVAQMTGLALRTVKRHFKSKKVPSRNHIPVATRNRILFHACHGCNPVVISKIVNVPVNRILRFLESMNIDEIQFRECKCGLSFPVVPSKFEARHCPFCRR